MRQPLLLILLSFCISSASIAADNETSSTKDYFNLKNSSWSYSPEHILEFWGYHAADNASNSTDTLKLRYYQPLSIGAMRGTARLDTEYVRNYGPSFPAENQGQYSAGNTLLTVWGNHPNFFSSWGGNLGARVIFPFGNQGQWAVGPQVGASYTPVEGSKTILANISPLVRYMYGFDTKKNSSQNNSTQSPLIRRLELFPTIGIQITPATQIRFWDENGIIYNSAGGGWFVPLDAMVTHRISKHFLFAVGAAKQVVQTYNQYNWTVYGKVAFNF
ncbi:hypothetical protein TUM22923_13560 [Polynucleobacter sp. TUM22923]|jgi:hypothetical protein|uniref:hypothetical protein n=1 Tax=Polynucleobacter sp. TUM22923 TaxID=3022126 RepID=UPI0025729FDA|nr:hypothetical protein [Polynucleobacter sp. TUM22923]BDX22035.1 hypothetical protein TUM22923_13560 [Polynucleobacter sp. TUM22923]